LICNYVEVNREDIKEDSRFIEDLGFTSYDFVSMLGELEEELGVTVDENDVLEIHTVGEAVEYLTDLQK
ncbi:MAG: acyl carrier protein, partial [Oscillospiraceae bacterium]|nr:acyl carrier protein [Oscillospiraceae bacterium]